MNAYHAELIDHLTQAPPPGYSSVSIHQVLRADRAAFTYMAEKLTTLKRNQRGQSPLQELIATVLSHPSVSFNLLPLPQGHATKKKTPPVADSPRKRVLDDSPPMPRRKAPKGRGKGKSRKGPRVPQGLIDKSLETKDGRRLCWAYNLGGCNEAAPGEACRRGLHLCAEPGCQRPHPLSQHTQS